MRMSLLPSPLKSDGRRGSAPERLKVAVTVVAAFIVTVQPPVPEQPPPLHPSKVDPLPATALNLIEVPDTTVSLQSPGQLMPAPLLLPAPVPPSDTARAKVEGAAVPTGTPVPETRTV